MKKLYDKIILAIALLVLLAGVAYYFMQAGAGSGMGGPAAGAPGGPAYEPVPVPETATTQANWPEPVEQAPGWLYDVFTPPKIYIDPKTGEFVPTGWKIVSRQPFGIYLAAIERKPYRIQLEGYIEEDRSDASKSLLLLYNQETDESIRGRVGDTIESADIEIRDFKLERRRDEFQNVTIVTRATILDKRSGEEVRLSVDETLYEKGVQVVIRSRENPGVRVVLTGAGERFNTPLGNYVLQEINLDAPSVTVMKEGDDLRQPVTRTLRPQKEQPKPSDAAPATPSPKPAEPGSLDGIFGS